MIRILLAHQSRLVCDSLRTALDKEEDVHVVGCAVTAEELRFLLPYSNMILLGPELEDAKAVDLINEIRLTHPPTKVLVLGVEECPEMIIRYVESGVAGYILHGESIKDVQDKLQAAHEEKAIVSPAIAAALMNRLNRLANLETPYAFMEARKTQLDDLTGREQEVLELISGGYTNQEIATELVVACGTVKNHVHKVLKKLEVSNRHEAAAIYQMHRQPSPANTSRPL